MSDLIDSGVNEITDYLKDTLKVEIEDIEKKLQEWKNFLKQLRDQKEIQRKLLLVSNDEDIKQNSGSIEETKKSEEYVYNAIYSLISQKASVLKQTTFDALAKALNVFRKLLLASF